MKEDLVRAVGISKRFGGRETFFDALAARVGLRRPRGSVRALDGVDLTIGSGEVMGLVGESGCGKSTLGRIIAGILEPSDGALQYRGQPAGKRQPAATRLDVQMVFQDAMASLNPRMRVRDIVGEAPLFHGIVSRADMPAYVTQMLERAGLDPSLQLRYPHQFSGGQRARIGIARALAVNPWLIVCDESTAALDVSVQAQVINLFLRLRAEMGLAYLFISHDIGVIQHVADRVAVMYLGRIVEEATTEDLFSRANHPYTQALLSEAPRLEPGKRRFSAIKGEIPSPLAPPSGCHFHPRCPHAFARCKVEAPILKGVASGHRSACHLNDAAPNAATGTVGENAMQE